MRPRRHLHQAPVPRFIFADFRFPIDVIVLAVRWYLRLGLAYRDIEELLAERGVEVDHVTVYRWVLRSTPLLAEAAGPWPAAQQPPCTADVLDLAEDRLEGLLPLRVAGLGRLALELDCIAARSPWLLDADGLPSWRGLPWRACFAGGISSSGPPSMVVRLAIDQYPESTSSMSERSAIPAAARVAAVALSMGWSCCRSLASWVNSAATITCSPVVTAWALSPCTLPLRVRRKRLSGVGDVGGLASPWVGRLVTRPRLELPRWLAFGAGSGGGRCHPLLVPLLARGRLGLQQRLGLAQPIQPAGLAGKRRGQLVPTGVAEQLVLAPVDRGGLAQDLGDLFFELLEGAVGLVSGVAGQLGASSATVPTQTMPAAAHNLREATRNPASALWWRTPNRAMVTWSGVWLAASTRKAMSSWQRRWICREERTPRQ
jgi:hypothetical protein